MSGDHRYLAVTILLMIERYCRLIVSQVPLIAAKLVGLAQDRLMQIRLKCSRSADLVSLCDRAFDGILSKRTDLSPSAKRINRIPCIRSLDIGIIISSVLTTSTPPSRYENKNRSVLIHFSVTIACLKAC